MLIRFTTTLLVLLASLAAHAQNDLAVLIDASGDGLGNTLDSPTGVVTDAAGNIYVSGRVSDNVFRITPGGVITEIIDGSGDGMGNALSGASHLAVDAGGSVYVIGEFSDNAFRIDPNGTITEVIDSTGDGAGNGLSTPRDIAVTANGTVFVCGSSSNNAFKIETNGVITEIIDAAGDGTGNPLSVPWGVAADAFGNAWVMGRFSANVFKIDANGVITEIIDVLGDGMNNRYGIGGGIAVDPAGNVYVDGGTQGSNLGSPNNFGPHVFKIEPSGTISVLWSNIPNPPASFGIWQNCSDIVLDASGAIYVNGSAPGSVFRIDPGGSHTQLIDDDMNGRLGLPGWNPSQMALDGSGGLLVSDASSDVLLRSWVPYPGSNADMVLGTELNGLPLFDPIKSGAVMDTLTIHIDSPGGTYVGDVPFLVADLFPTSTPFAPRSAFFGLPLYVDLTTFIFLFDGASAGGLLGPLRLPAGGMSFSTLIPAGLSGRSVMLQGGVYAPNPGNPVITFTDGHEIQVP